MTTHAIEAGDAIASELGERIHLAMWRQRVSQRELARRTTISQPTISRIVRGDAAPSITDLFAIGAALGVHPADLIDELESARGLVTSGAPALLPELDSNQQPSGYSSAQISAAIVDLDVYRALRRAS